jgi:hypothetical protein
VVERERAESCLDIAIRICLKGYFSEFLAGEVFFSKEVRGQPFLETDDLLSAPDFDFFHGLLVVSLSTVFVSKVERVACVSALEPFLETGLIPLAVVVVKERAEAGGGYRC